MGSHGHMHIPLTIKIDIWGYKNIIDLGLQGKPMNGYKKN